MDFERPKGWRKGQTIFNFLEWVSKTHHDQNKTETTHKKSQSIRMADPFYWPDEDFDRAWQDYQAHLKKQKLL